MCGIAGWVSYQRDLRLESETVMAMANTLAHRGPDASGVWLDTYVALGHRRLAVIDREGGGQPMTVEADGAPVSISYCGEVYNYRQLRARLITRGHPFLTHSDTEVLLRGYLEWGDDVVKELNGIYAFAIADTRQRTLLMARDRLGVKPLFYYPTDDGVIFGSEPKAILAHPCATRVVSADGLRYLFTSIKSPGTAVWAGMKEVRPGAVLKVDAHGLRERAYWILKATEHTDDLLTTVMTTRRLMQEAVEMQLVADVPQCVLLSGGLDSSAIAALAARVSATAGQPIATVALDLFGADDRFVPTSFQDTNDVPFARDVARHIRSAHVEVSLSADTIADGAVRRATVDARDGPGAGDMDQSLYLMCQAVRQRAVVALSGESADELFGGYRQFHDPQVVARHAFPWLSAARPGTSAAPTASLIRPDVQSALRLPEYTRDMYWSAMSRIPRLNGEDPRDARMREISYLYLTHFLPRLLERKDRMSMANGVEIRVPFCDHHLVEYVFNTPWWMKAFDNREKSILRWAAQDVLPTSVVTRKKCRYPLLQDPRYAVALRAQAREIIDGADDATFDLYDREVVRQAVDSPADQSGSAQRFLEQTLEMNTWIQVGRPQFTVT